MIKSNKIKMLVIKIMFMIIGDRYDQYLVIASHILLHVNL